MEGIGNMLGANIYSLRQAINISNLRNVMNQDQQSIDNLMKGMEESNRTNMKLSVQPHKGANLDISL